MKILNQPVSPMYLWTIALLAALSALSAYTLHELPAALLLAVASAALAEIAIRALHLGLAFRMPYSGIITGLIIGAVAPVNAPFPLVAAAAVIAVLSKFFLQYRGSNILNPASAGLLVALPLFGLGDEWWIAGSYNLYGIAITLTPILVVLAYESKRLQAGLSFAAVSFMLAVALSPGSTASAAALLPLLFGINYLFAFVMLVEPKTSPSGPIAQVVYGCGLALAYPALAYVRVPYPLLVCLLAANAAYAAYRWRTGRR